MTYLDRRIEELKETSGNRDFSQGGVNSGVTAASAIAALQEAGSKLSRDMVKSSYRAFVKECYLCIELMRQFYDTPRCFRITGESGAVFFAEFSGQRLRAHPLEPAFGMDMGLHSPEFDVQVTAAKKSTFSRLSQNEMAQQLYRLGMFVPENAVPALACLEMMDFEGIEKVRNRIRENADAAQRQAILQAMQIAAVQQASETAEESMPRPDTAARKAMEVEP